MGQGSVHAAKRDVELMIGQVQKSLASIFVNKPVFINIIIESHVSSVVRSMALGSTDIRDMSLGARSVRKSI